MGRGEGISKEFDYHRISKSCQPLTKRRHNNIFNHIFSPQTTVVDGAAALREKLTEIKGLGPAAQYGLFLADEDPKKGVWLEPGRTLEHYLLRENVSTWFFFSLVLYVIL